MLAWLTHNKGQTCGNSLIKETITIQGYTLGFIGYKALNELIAEKGGVTSLESYVANGHNRFGLSEDQ